MDGKDLQERAAERALELPGSVLTHPFGEEWDVYKVRGKVFMLHSDQSGERHVTLKARPEDAHALREAYDDIRPGYHMNKKHWISVYPDGRVDPELLGDLVTESYLLVVATLPRDQRPVDPDTFGQA